MEECQWEPLVPMGYTEEELERDNPYNQWMYEDETKGENDETKR
jgi:hypothetical protein